jgi:[ribosomal protein S5]-alanine N-acetyltransferase
MRTSRQGRERRDHRASFLAAKTGYPRFHRARSDPTMLPLHTVFSGERVSLRAPKPSDAERIIELRRRSREHLAPWEPLPRVDESDLVASRTRIRQQRSDFRADLHYRFCITLGARGPIIGRVALSQVSRGYFQNTILGYWVDVEHTGRGYTTEAVRLALAVAFGPLGLHRVEAAIMPRNAPSLAVARKAGMREIGLSHRYIEIAGTWEDCLIFAITAEEHAGRR